MTADTQIFFWGKLKKYFLVMLIVLIFDANSYLYMIFVKERRQLNIYQYICWTLSAEYATFHVERITLFTVKV